MKSCSEWLKSLDFSFSSDFEDGAHDAWSACAAEYETVITNLQASRIADELLHEQKIQILERQLADTELKLKKAMDDIDAVTAPIDGPNGGCTIDELLDYMKVVRKSHKLDEVKS